MIQMSVIILTPDTYASVRRLMSRLTLQSVRQKLEIVIVCPDAQLLNPDMGELQVFAGVNVVEVGIIHSTSPARAAGIRAAKGHIVVLTEEHCLPDPDWAEALIRAHTDSGWDGVGPTVLNGNPRTVTSWSNFLLEYNEWLYPHAGGQVRHLPGHNSAFKRDSLLSYGDRLGLMLESETVLHWDMTRKGLKLAIEPSARTRHFNYSLFFSSITLRYRIGKVFGGLRCNNWSPVRRMLYVIGSPLIPLVRLRRILAQMLKPGRPRALIPKILPALALFLLCDGIGQMAGYAVGIGDTALKVTEVDFYRERYMNARDRAELQNGDSCLS
ncbi:MAG TPA: glycosyltransferase [Syntrophorhabdaceae bacterium]|nr:glycosyltransferase [Syntrophorhabdaceae bacterium]